MLRHARRRGGHAQTQTETNAQSPKPKAQNPKPKAQGPEPKAPRPAQVECYSGTGLPVARPNSMNKYGLVLNEIGMEPLFDHLQRKAIGRISTHTTPLLTTYYLPLATYDLLLPAYHVLLTTDYERCACDMCMSCAPLVGVWW